MPPLITVTSVTLPCRSADTLLEQLDAELEQRYPKHERRQLDLKSGQFGPGRGVFLLASTDGLPVGCCALRGLNCATGELRRMYVLPSVRGRGVGSRLLAEIERHARQGGLERLVLATGLRQPEALCLYEKHGYIRIQCHPDQAFTRLSVCMMKIFSGD